MSEALKDRGFEIVITEDCQSMYDQVGLFRNCEVLVTEIGAGVNNVIFCKNNNLLLLLSFGYASWENKIKMITLVNNGNLIIIRGKNVKEVRRGHEYTWYEL